MKYYHDAEDKINRYTWYRDLNKLPFNTPIYGFAYDINDDTEYRNLSCLPILGELSMAGSIPFFFPYKKGTTERRKSGSIGFRARMYADTYEEAVEMYNELVQQRIDKLKRLIESAEKEKIVV